MSLFVYLAICFVMTLLYLLNYRLYHSWIELFELVFNDNKGVSELYCFALWKKHVKFVYPRSSINPSMPIGIALFLSISLLVIYFESKGYLVINILIQFKKCIL